mgnify:CR=1 FL=1
MLPSVLEVVEALVVLYRNGQAFVEERRDVGCQKHALKRTGQKGIVVRLSTVNRLQSSKLDNMYCAR